MLTVIIGGGKGCQAILELAHGAFLRELVLDVACVMDLDCDAPGMLFARERGLKTTTDLSEALATPDLELIIEVTGQDAVMEQIRKKAPPNAKLLDHMLLHAFWDLANAQKMQRCQLAEKENLEKRLMEEKSHIQSFFDSIPDMVIVLDKNKCVTRTNARFYEFTGMVSEEVIGQKCSNMIVSSRMKGNCMAACPFDQVLATGESRSIVHHIPPPDESYWEVTLSPITEGSGKISGVIEAWHRITEKVMLRREVEQSEQRFRQFIDSARDLISIKDLEGHYVVVNKASATAFNLKEEDFIGKRAEDVLPEATAKVVNFHDKEVIWKKRHCTFEEIFEINGRNRHFHTTRFPLTDYKGDLMGVCTITRDVTERIQLQEQLMQSAKLVAVGQLAAGVAHEINNPLTGILAFAEDMRDEVEADSDMHADLNVIIRETLRCREIVRNLLDFAKQDTPKFEMINLNKVVDQALTLVVKLPRFKDITLEKNKAKRIPYIQADPQQLQQVVMNLILNAGDAMKGKGSVILTTEYNRKQDKCIVTVEDTGPGIPENLIDKVFEPFFSSKGTSGLGLALSWGIVERHRGIIEVDTAESGGAIFRVILPALVDVAEDE